jgi:transcriptional regulator with XRE-family HTH domain
MSKTLKQFKARALARPEVRKAYEDLADEFAFLDEVLRARTESGLTQAEVAERAGTTQSAIARLESAGSSHSPSVATLQRYAQALGYRVEIRLVKKRGLTSRSSGRAEKNRRALPASRRRAA